MKQPWIPSVVSGAIVAAVLGWLIASGSWNFVGIWVEPSPIGWTTGFADLGSLTATADCVKTGSDVTVCDPYGRPFQPYAMLPSRLLVALGVGLPQTGILGIVLASTYVVVVGALVWVTGRNWTRGAGEFYVAATLLTLTAVTPPALLAVERGQVEILVLAAAVLGLALTARTSGLASAVGALSLFLSAILKYFNVGIFLAYLAPRRWSWWAAAAMVSTALFLVVNWSDVAIAQETAGASGSSTSRVMFGAQTAWVTLVTADPRAFFAPERVELPLMGFRLASLVAVFVLAATWWFLLRRINLAHVQDLAWHWLVGGLGAVMLPFALGNSNDYRLILLLPALAGAFVWLGRGGPRSVLWVLATLIAFTCATNAWMIPNPSGWLMPEGLVLAGDVALMAVVAFGLALVTRAWTPRASLRSV